MNGIPIVDIGGGPRERGLAHGRALGPEIDRLYRTWMTHAAEGRRPIVERDAVGFAMGLLPESRSQAPDLVAEVEAIAEGAGLPFETVWFLNCFDEAGGYWAYKDYNLGRACTTIAATGHSTTDGATYVGQSWDLNEWYDSIVLRIAPSADEAGALVYTHPGIVGGTGINAHGIALVWNSMHAKDQRLGVPVPFLVRLALRQKKLSDAISAALTPVRAIGFNFIIGADFGAANLEASATRQHVTYIGRHLAHANHFDSQTLRELEGNTAYHGSSFVRGGRMNQLLDEVAGHIDLETCQRLFRDHANHPGSICAHLDPPDFPYLTKAAFVYVPAERVMYVTDGPPCGAPFQELRLEPAAVTA
jgi:isopenicillin-N N-acyltransferase-like protein